MWKLRRAVRILCEGSGCFVGSLIIQDSECTATFQSIASVSLGGVFFQAEWKTASVFTSESEWSAQFPIVGIHTEPLIPVHCNRRVKAVQNP